MRVCVRAHAHAHTHTHTHIKIMCSSRLFIENCSSISEMKVPHNHTIHELLFLFHNRSFMRCMASSCQEIIKTILRCLRTRYLLYIQDNVIRFLNFSTVRYSENPLKNATGPFFISILQSYLIKQEKVHSNTSVCRPLRG